jgi:site-specific DNA-methyltransferase (adenine-specific)
MNSLYFGDNLDVLREKVKDESVDLVYLDPPFKSNANYNVLFKPGGEASEAQAEAFRDTWEWGDSARDAYDDVIKLNGDVGLVMSGFRRWLGENSMMAYLSMMTIRLLELRRVMKPNASLYLHCDPTASHYLKLLLDAIFDHNGWRNEIIWKRTPFSGSSKALAKQLPRSHDVIHYYTNGDDWFWNPPTEKYKDEYLARFKWDDNDGRGPYRKTLLKTYSQETFDRLKGDNRLVMPMRAGAKYSYKQYLQESSGTRQVDDLWTDINALNPMARERLGYPTQKPITLLQRIIEQSSKKGMTVLDPFCGCGTTVAAAQVMERQWIGIDVTHYAVTLIERRLLATNAPKGSFQVLGRPTDLAGAHDLARRDKHQFQWWAAWRLGARWYHEEKRGPDRGIDGRMMFKNGPFGDGLIIVSVKGGENIGVKYVRDLRGVIERDEAEMGVLITLHPPTGPMIIEAAAAGNVSKSAHGKLPRLQILTIEDMLEGRMPKLPPLPVPSHVATRAPKKEDRGQLELLLPFAGDRVAPMKGDFVDPSIMQLGA